MLTAPDMVHPNWLLRPSQVKERDGRAAAAAQRRCSAAYASAAKPSQTRPRAQCPVRRRSMAHAGRQLVFVQC